KLLGIELRYEYDDVARTGDHICYITDLKKVQAHFPNWELQYDLPAILDSIADRQIAKGAIR
ncbi:MAG: NAD-dependent epimerase/dehydratase, partial [Bryobacterales bacterium]|nr:NAD-dependent epimerase/dehydratase [Bryobacterales bacterium]